ncbi:MAG: Flp pilus assembly protein CpaB [Streptosporangiales bacterium]|nr:Flp pilus assembly protein CpaB [Streptosporangiales bacterium]
MNPRQRRGAALMIVATLGAIVVFVTVLSYVSSVRAEVGDLVTVLKLKQDVAANGAVTKAQVEEAEVPKRWLSGPFVSDTRDLDGKVAVNELKKGSYLQTSMIIDAPSLRPGQREIAIMIDAETGVAGKVTSGSVVDVYATYTESTGTRSKSCATQLLSHARVIEVGRLRTEKGEGGNEDSQADLSQVVPVTFALSQRDTKRLAWAEGYATKVRLALIGPGTTEDEPDTGEVCSIDPVKEQTP